MQTKHKDVLTEDIKKLFFFMVGLVSFVVILAYTTKWASIYVTGTDNPFMAQCHRAGGDPSGICDGIHEHMRIK